MTDEAARAVAAAAAVGLAVADGEVAGLVVQSATGVIEAATPEAEEILGLSLGQMLGRASADPRWAAVGVDGVALRPQDHPAIRALMTGRPVYGTELGVHRPGRDRAGEHVWLRVDSVPFNFVDGAPTNVVVRFSVLSGQRATELRLAESERLYRFLIDNAPDIVAWQLPDTTFLWVSPASETLLGYAPEEMVGRTAYEFMHPYDRATSQATAWMAGRSPSPESIVVRMRHRGGHHIWMEVAGQVLRDADGNPAQLRTSWRDVTARVEAERGRDAALQLVQSVVANAPIGIAVCTEDGLMQQVNAALCTMLGRDSAQLLGRRVDEFLHPEAECSDRFSALLSGELPVDESECRYVRPDGTPMWGHRTAVVLRDGDGRGDPRLLLHLQDVTERRTAHDALTHAATHDALTGLANRVAFTEHLAAMRRRLGPDDCSGLLFIDLDDFKAVNDTYGHEIGDELLTVVGARLRESIRPQDFAARLGGDEFVVHCRYLTDHQGAVDIAKRIVDKLSEPYRLGARTISISASIGVTTTTRDGHDRLMTSADRAMYRSKKAGRGLITDAADDPAPSGRADSVSMSDTDGDYDDAGPDNTLSPSESLDSDEVRNDDGDVVVDPPDEWIDAEEDETLDERLAAEVPDVLPRGDAEQATPDRRTYGQIDGTPEDGTSFYTVLDDDE
ncbi:PAS domain S-box/diguanylate cyclase (GGDEF) domain-containing protein [Mycolicibacterium chubuense NBB4]|uniref:PAS domain S-box/diguanylate cyclase (GGDEF) domain-containing protein n=1 Tax=Mycolicibacterium chubuense (strain NBB4) TaxID=710421 RepID=I4BQQ3_MYCCN|nr:sensor domain-containing diguanylate cyclase [Mycolicibacterium chubuense]AFM19610.1 PAS domain S-box/diguanylate cyclase (GGDEF) domain-containing protein [Mycolicibacterium chubuense NBB4]